MANPVLLALKSVVWGLGCSILWQCEPAQPPPLSPWLTEVRTARC